MLRGAAHLGCGAFSPDGTRLVLEGSSSALNDRTEVNGIYTVRDSDGGDLVRLTHGGTNPSYSPDGAQVVFAGTTFFGQQGTYYSNGSLFVVNADGTGLHRIMPPGSVPEPKSTS